MTTPTPARRVEYRPLDRIIRTTLRNPKRHADETLVASIRRFGFVDLVIEDGRTGELIAGHGRLDALEAIRATTPDRAPDGIDITPEGVWMVPITVGWASRDDHEAEALGVALNHAPEAGGWDRTELAHLLDDLSKRDALTGTGYDTDDVGRLLAGLAPPPSREPELDQTSPRPVATCPKCGHSFYVGARDR